MYNYKHVNDLQKEVKQFNITVTQKKFHTSKLYELKKLYYKLMEEVNIHLFNPDTEYYFYEYKLCINMGKTKKDMDHKLKLCILYLLRQLEQIKELAS